MQTIENLGVDAVFDALHGNIELSDFDKEHAGQIRAIISAPFVQRLRRIKQLGFVSQNFLSAQHNRYSHALGTIHIMRKLINRVDQGSDLFTRALQGVQELTNDKSFLKSKSRAVDRLKQHMLVAAAIQDVGELPYEKATAKIFAPGDGVRGTLRDAGVDLNQMTDKDVFTLSFVWNSDHANGLFEGLDPVLLTYLVSNLVPNGRNASDELLALRQMLDGTTIDADRLDYVYRDAFHTIGVHHTPDALIDSIVEYDHRGPALSHVRPVTDFIVTRAMLWSNVYLSPENRFRVILLRIALGELVKSKKRHIHRLIEWNPGAMTQENFLSVDDPFIDDLMERAAKAGLDLDQHAANALALLNKGAGDYEYKWVAFAGQEQPVWSDSFTTPVKFYWDTYADYRERTHTLYTPASVRIVGDRYSLLDNVYLEDCVGPFCRLLIPNLANAGSDTWPALPMPEHMVWFVPRDLGNTPQRAPWNSLYEARSAAQLTTHLQLNDPLSGIDFNPDTRSLEDFNGPAIFLAFAWEDRDYVSRIAAILFQLNRRYFVFLQNFGAYGTNPVANSKKGVDEADAVILLASVGYKTKWHNDVGGAIYGEMLRMQFRKDEIAIVPMALDSEAELKEDFPWEHVTPDGKMPYLGPPLRGASTEVFKRAVVGVLDAIDRRRASA